MPTISRTINTEIPIDRAFAYLADFSNAAAWDPGTVSSTPRDEAGPSVGQIYDLVVAWGDRRLPMEYRITELIDGERVALVGDGSTTHAVDTITFEERLGGGTTVTYTADIRLKGLLRLAEPFLGSKFDALGDDAEAGITTQLARLATHDGA
jgi:hypothetical protein